MSEIPDPHNKTIVKTKQDGQDPLVSPQPTGKATFQISNRPKHQLMGRETESTHVTKTSVGMAGAILGWGWGTCLGCGCNCCKKAKLPRVG